MIGPTFQGVDELIDQDPDAVWDPNLNGGDGGVDSPIYGTGLASPRVVKVALFDPTQVTQSGMQSIEFNNSHVPRGAARCAGPRHGPVPVLRER